MIPITGEEIKIVDADPQSRLLQVANYAGLGVSPDPSCADGRPKAGSRESRTIIRNRGTSRDFPDESLHGSLRIHLHLQRDWKGGALCGPFIFSVLEKRSPSAFSEIHLSSTAVDTSSSGVS
jgi:hypothetical protein